MNAKSFVPTPRDITILRHLVCRTEYAPLGMKMRDQLGVLTLAGYVDYVPYAATWIATPKARLLIALLDSPYPEVILPAVMSSIEASQEFGIGTSTIRMAIRAGRLEARKVGQHRNDPYIFARGAAESLWKKG